MFEYLKKYCEWEKLNVEGGWDKEKAIDRAYGAMMFCYNFCNLTEKEKKEIADYWEEILNYFRKGEL